MNYEFVSDAERGSMAEKASCRGKVLAEGWCGSDVGIIGYSSSRIADANVEVEKLTLVENIFSKRQWVRISWNLDYRMLVHLFFDPD